MNPIQNHMLSETRRYFFGRMAKGLGEAALGSILNPNLFAADVASDNPADKALKSLGQMKILHHAPKAKRVIWLFMADAPSQLDLWDYKPKLQESFDKELPESIRNGQRITTMTSGQTRFPWAPSVFKFNRHGKHGAWISELMPNVGSIADDITVVKSVHT